VSRRYSHASDWGTLAIRLEDVVAAHSGEDTFDEVHALLIAKIAHECRLLPFENFLPSSGRIDRIAQWLTAAAELWPGLHTTYKCTLPEQALAACDALLRGTNVTDRENAGLDAVFEYLTTRTAKGSKGQFFTPRHVVAHMLDVLAPASSECVLDPACGSGAFLTRSKQLVSTSTIYGADLSARAVRVCRTALISTGTDPRSIVCMDTLNRQSPPPQEWPGGFDVIATNPPFAGVVSEDHARDYTLHRPNRRTERDVLFMERCIELLKPMGRIGLVVPHNKVGSGRYSEIRHWLLRHLRVFAVVSLPANTFAPHTSQRAVIIYGQKRSEPLRTPQTDEAICFFVSTMDAKHANGRLRMASNTGKVAHDLHEATENIRAHIARCPGGVQWG
jgi:type I restriction enzyme M protein